MVTAVTQVTMSVSALLAFQRLAEISFLPAQLRIRPTLLTVADQTLPITAAERQVLTEAGLLTGGTLDAEMVTILRALVYGDTEIDMTLGAPGRADTFVCLVRRSRLLVSAIRCGDDVTLDAYVDVAENAVIALLASTIRSYLFGDDGEAAPARIPQVRFAAGDVVAAMTAADVFDGSLTFYEAVKPFGVPESVSDVLYQAEKSPLGRAEVSAYLSHEGARSGPDTIVQITNCAAGAVMTSCRSDNTGGRWITAEPYDHDELERRIATAIRSVPGAAWFTHCRTD